MKSQSKRKFTYQGQAYDLPDYFDCCLEIYAFESDPDPFPYYSKPTIRKSLDIDERWCRTSKAEVLGPIHWDLVTDHTGAIEIIYHNSRMGKYLDWYEANDSIFLANCPVRLKAGIGIFKNFFNYFKEQNCYSDRLYSFKSDDCATLYKTWFYDEYYVASEFGTVPPSLEHIREDCLKLKNFVKEQPRSTALSYIACLLQTSASLTEFFKSAEILQTVDLSNPLIDWSLIERPNNLLTKNSFEAFDIPPACECELGTVNYLSLWYQVKKQLFDIINE